MLCSFPWPEDPPKANVHAAKLAVLLPPWDGKLAKLVMVEALCGHCGVIWPDSTTLAVHMHTYLNQTTNPGNMGSTPAEALGLWDGA
jgi:hypothetical protein